MVLHVATLDFTRSSGFTTLLIKSCSLSPLFLIAAFPQHSPGAKPDRVVALLNGHVQVNEKRGIC